LLRAVDSQPGQTVLELAAGTGDTGFDSAERIGPTGADLQRHLARDARRSRRRGRQRGIDNVDYRLIDAERIDLDDDCVDGVLCRFG